MGLLALALAATAGCEEPAAPAPAASTAARVEDGARAESGEGQRLGVPPAQIHRARREAAGLDRMSEAIRRGVLARRLAAGGPAYEVLRADAEAHAHAPISLEGRVSLARAAGPRLWILALHTRREGEGWADPLYVLSVVDPKSPADEGVEARVHGWVVGTRTIGRHALPLIVAYAVEPDDV